MRSLAFGIGLSLLLIGGVEPVSAARAGSNFQQETLGHGGGCRKSSPAGQCCHMDRKTGVVHCH